MFAIRNGALHLFRAFGIDVYLHWMWFVAAIWIYQSTSNEQTSVVWFIVDYVALFGIVLLHEFGHSLACRQVGGEANRIVLWPLGGVAYVSPPPRPGAVLWSIAAGPLVNLVLALLSFGLLFAMHRAHLGTVGDPAWRAVRWIMGTNLVLLVFNLLPIYPLDGGQILQSLLWFVLGRGRSLRVSVVIGFLGAAGMALLAWYEQDMWYGFVAFFIFTRCHAGWNYAKGLLLLESVPRRPGVACPHCHAEAPQGELWSCVKCRQPFDPFASFGTCPHCQAQYAEIWCLDCAQWATLEAWEHGGRSADVPSAPSAFPSSE